LAPPPARWGNSVLSTALSPIRPAQGSTTGPYFVGLLVSPPLSQPLCFVSPLLGASLAPLGGWLVTPPLFSACVTFPTFIPWEFHSLSHLHSLGQVQCSTPPLLQVLDCNLLLCFSVFLWGIQYARRLHLSMFPGSGFQGVGRESHMVLVAHLLILQVYASSFGTSW
jgi:hypothetical protein